MDRDQVNCIHHLYQGDPAPRITRAVLYGQTGVPGLVWCNSDKVEPLLGGILQEDSEGLGLLPGCFNFLDRVEDQLRQLPRPDYAFGYPFSTRIRKPGEARPAFLAIPYSPPFDDVKPCVIEACRSKSFQCEVTGDLSLPGAIMDQVWQGIRSADVVIADITGDNPNVLFEVGLSAALGKEVIVISQKETLPFDIRGWRRIQYAADELRRLSGELAAALASVSPRYPFEGSEPQF